MTTALIVGREEGCGLLLSEGRVSGKHAKITYESGVVWLQDLGSASGTFVNGSRIAKRVRLVSGDRLRFDEGEEFDFVYTSRPGLSQPPVPGQSPVSDAATPPVNDVRKPSPANDGGTPSPVNNARKPSPANGAGKASPVNDAGTPSPVNDARKPSPANGAEKPSPVNDARKPSPRKRPGAWADTAALLDVVGGTDYLAPAEIRKRFEASANAGVLRAGAWAIGPHLQVVSGKSAPLTVELSTTRAGRTEWTIGSTAGLDIVLDEKGVSALHAKLINEGRRWKVIDQMSANGTYVNGKRSSIAYLAGGDRLSFGPVTCVFQDPGLGERMHDWISGAGWWSRSAGLAILVGVAIGALLALVANRVVK